METLLLLYLLGPVGLGALVIFLLATSPWSTHVQAYFDGLQDRLGTLAVVIVTLAFVFVSWVLAEVVLAPVFAILYLFLH